MRESPKPGEVFEGHAIEGVIGRGGMGIVYRARSIALDRPRAIKVIAPELSADPAYAGRFRRESRLAASVEHPNVVPVHAAGEDDGLLFIVMRLVDGVDLHRLIADGPLKPSRALEIVKETASALDAAHRAGLVHRDVKPANVLIEPRANDRGEHVYLTDFGIAKPTSTKTAGGSDRREEVSITIEGEVLGTSDYVAPEQIEHGVADARSDVYSLACVAFHVLTGAPPFRRETDLATLIAQTKAERPAASSLQSTLSASVDDVLKRGMAIDPDERPQSAGAFAEQLEAAMDGVATPVSQRRPAVTDLHQARTTRLPTPPPAGRDRRLIFVGVGLLVAVAAAVVAVLLLDGGSDTSDPGQPTVVSGDVGEGPVGVAVGDQRVWVASKDAPQGAPGTPPGEVDRLLLNAPVQKESKPPIPIPSPKAVATGFSSVWVVNGDALYRLGGSREVDPIDVGGDPDDVVVDGNFVWVSDEDNDAVVRVDPYKIGDDGTAKIVRVPVCDTPRSITADNGHVWVACAGSKTDSDAGEVDKIDAVTAKVIDTVEVGPQPTSIAAGPSSVWVADNSDHTLQQIDVRTAKLDPDTINLEPGPRGVAVGFGLVWVCSGPGNVVERFDAKTHERVGDPIKVGTDPADIAVGERAVYTANQGSSTVSRILVP